MTLSKDTLNAIRANFRAWVVHELVHTHKMQEEVAWELAIGNEGDIEHCQHLGMKIEDVAAKIFTEYAI